MPLRFLKKCRHYNVTSKSLFVISVHHLLDTSTTVDCTNSSESKGQECLDNVCQRLSIQQPEFFGLRYVVKGKENDDEMKWIDLERSLSRQLEKYAAGTKIYLRVRHYVTNGMRHLTDDTTRYYYFLQLKNDIYEGRIACDIRTAILLALYCRQAEYDSYQNDKQPKEFLKKSLVLPKNLQGLANDDLLDSLIMEVLQQNSGIQHLTQGQAEEMYIQCCQQLDGYGEERFQAKDTLGNDLTLGLTINGMIVTAENGRQYFPWKDFNEVTIEKRTIKILQNKTDGSIVGSFIFAEAEMARYFWKLCITQHKFFKRHIDEDAGGSQTDAESANGMSIAGTDSGNAMYGVGVTTSYNFNDSREDLLLEQQQQQQQHRAIYSSNSNASVLAAGLGLGVNLQQQHQQMPHALMASNNSNALVSSNISLAASHQSSGATTHNWLSKDFAHDYVSSQQLSSSILDTRLQSSSCLDLSNNNLHSSGQLMAHNNNHLLSADAHERERLKAMLPTYRPAPDYETAVLRKYRTPSNDIYNMSNLPYQATASNAALPNYYAGSQPDVHSATTNNLYADDMLLAPARYPDVTQSAAAAMHVQHHFGITANNNAAAAGNPGFLEMAQRLQTMRNKPPPPPYPVNRLSSSSTPDLAVASHRTLLGHRTYVSGSSPDLVSNRNLYNATQHRQYAAHGPTSSGAMMMYQHPYMSQIGHSQPYLAHGTFENLNMIEEQPSIMSQLRLAAQQSNNNNQSYELNSPTLPPSGYRASTVSAPSAQSAVLQRNALNGSAEPIYENVPLPQYANNSTPVQRNTDNRSSSSSHNSEAMRQRASSIQSAPAAAPPVPAVRHHIKQSTLQQQQSQLQQLEPAHADKNYVDRAASSEVQFLEPTPMQRTMRAASAAPALSINTQQQQQQQQTPPPRQHKNNNFLKNNSSLSAVDVIPNAKSNQHISRHAASQDDTLLQQQFSAMNISNASSTSNMYNSSSNNTTNTTSSSTKEVKRKKRWNILGRSKTPDKQRAATLGREKTPNSTKLANKTKLAQDDSNLPQRWSTGVPKLQPISGQYSKDMLCQILNDKLNDVQLYREFESIPKRRDVATYSYALMNENIIKNANPNFLPYDDNRVRITPTMENRLGYVNASHISATVGTKQRFYIIAQSPHIELTTRIFWQCVWEADVYLIVQQSHDINYFPANSHQSLEFGQFQVFQEFSQTTDRCITSKLRLFHIQSRRYRSVWHLNYTDWAEQNCPRDVNHFLDFLEELNSVRMASINEVPPGHNTNPPVLIHCMEGGERSGLTLTADLLLYTLDHNQDLDIPRVIGQLRHQRDSIIPSLAQYKFIYSLLISYLKRTRLI